MAFEFNWVLGVVGVGEIWGWQMVLADLGPVFFADDGLNQLTLHVRLMPHKFRRGITKLVQDLGSLYETRLELVSPARM